MTELLASTSSVARLQQTPLYTLPPNRERNITLFSWVKSKTEYITPSQGIFYRMTAIYSSRTSFRRVKEALPKTDNGVEGRYNFLNRAINSSWPSIWKFVKTPNSVEIKETFEGGNRLRRKEKYMNAVERIKRTAPEDDRRPILDYLRNYPLSSI